MNSFDFFFYRFNTHQDNNNRGPTTSKMFIFFLKQIKKIFCLDSFHSEFSNQEKFNSFNKIEMPFSTIPSFNKLSKFIPYCEKYHLIYMNIKMIQVLMEEIPQKKACMRILQKEA